MFLHQTLTSMMIPYIASHRTRHLGRPVINKYPRPFMPGYSSSSDSGYPRVTQIGKDDDVLIWTLKLEVDAFVPSNRSTDKRAGGMLVCWAGHWRGFDWWSGLVRGYHKGKGSDMLFDWEGLEIGCRCDGLATRQSPCGVLISHCSIVPATAAKPPSHEHRREGKLSRDPHFKYHRFPIQTEPNRIHLLLLQFPLRPVGPQPDPQRTGPEHG
ncbi:hypothetical protein F4801DRAFT_432263 [Xylaria longipes]|nr:hypothetical protein F4801DRAFT_432263 [Xylaria longipes]